MYKLTITLDEGKNSCKIHGSGANPSEGERDAAASIAASVRENFVGHCPDGKFGSDVTLADATDRPVTDADEQPQDLDELFAGLGED